MAENDKQGAVSLGDGRYSAPAVTYMIPRKAIRNTIFRRGQSSRIFPMTGAARDASAKKKSLKPCESKPDGYPSAENS